MGKAKGSVIRKQMVQLLREWKRSGEPATSFARRKGITGAKFFYWKRVLGAGTEVKRSRSRRFVPVRIVESGQWSEGGGLVEIVFDSGERVRVSDGVSEQTLRLALRVMRERC